MTYEEYLRAALTSLADPVSREWPHGESMESAILAKVLAKRFRKFRAEEVAVSLLAACRA